MYEIKASANFRQSSFLSACYVNCILFEQDEKVVNLSKNES